MTAVTQHTSETAGHSSNRPYLVVAVLVSVLSVAALVANFFVAMGIAALGLLIAFFGGPALKPGVRKALLAVNAAALAAGLLMSFTLTAAGHGEPTVTSVVPSQE